MLSIAAMTGCSISPDMTLQAPPTVVDVTAAAPKEMVLAETSTTNPATDNSE